MDSVSIAFELMRLELENEVESLNADGAKCFRDSEYAKARQLSERGVALKEFCQKIAALEEEWSERFRSDYDEERGPEELNEVRRTILSGSKAPKTGLLVRFPDGNVICERQASQTLVKTIERIGADRVSKLGIYVNSENLVSETPSALGYSETYLEPYYIKTHSSTEQKRRNVERISEMLDLSIEVEII